MATGKRQALVSRQTRVSPHSQPDARWDALCRRDKQADGTFVYAVITTGIYCAPSCASRLPRRENVRFFDATDQAEQAGFRPCKRCRQGMQSRTAWQHACIERACQLMAQAETPLALTALAHAVGISPYHFHRLFKAQLGVTPKGYAMALRGQRVRQALRDNTPVAQAALDAGFTSSGQCYATSHKVLGMSPTRFKHKGKGMEIQFALGRCSLGEILVAESARGVCAILLGDDAQALIDELQTQFANATLVGGNAAFEQCMALVVGFIDTPGAAMPLPLDIRGTAFQLRVWQALREIPPGSTLSYRDIASKIGQPGAVRAVAGACAANCLAVAIPCHRVIRSDGEIAGYRWGVARKRQLLLREKARYADD